jgi:hypothetical protein
LGTRGATVSAVNRRRPKADAAKPAMRQSADHPPRGTILRGFVMESIDDCHVLSRNRYRKNRPEQCRYSGRR